MSLGLTDDDDRRAFCRRTWSAVTARPVPDQATLDMCMGILAAHGSDALVGFLETSPEGKAVMAARRRLLGLNPA